MVNVKKNLKKSLYSIIIIAILAFIFMIPGQIIAEEENTEEEETTTIVIPSKLSFNVVYPKISEKAGTVFIFNAELTYDGIDEAIIDLSFESPDDWSVNIKPAYQETPITAVKMTPGKKETLKITASPPLIKAQQKPGDFEVTLKAENEELDISAETTFLATVTATYNLSYTPKFGVYNTKATSGKNNPFTVVLKNTGSDTIENIAFKSDSPQKWIVKYNPEKIEKLAADESRDIEITITPPDKTIAGDYMLNFSASSDNASGNMDIRVTVETPTIWGWIGIAIIVIVVIGIAIIFARLGRR